MNHRFSKFIILVLFSVFAAPAFPQHFLRTRNTKSNLDFFVGNKGVDFFNTQSEGLFWSRGSSDFYMFGGGLWFAGKKYFPQPKSGYTWSSAGSIADSVVTICANPKTRTLLAGSLPLLQNSANIGLYHRSDAEKMWNNVSIPIKRIGVTSISVLPNGSELIGADSGFWFVAEDGNSWTRIAGTKGEVTTAMSSEGVVSTYRNSSGNNIYIPNADFTAWTLRTSPTNFKVKFLSSAQSGKIILTATAQSAYLSSDNGMSWMAISGSPIFSGVALAGGGNVMFIAIEDGGIYSSEDQGKTWTQRNQGLRGTTDFRSVILKTYDGSRLALGTNTGVYLLPTDSLKSGVWVDETLGIYGPAAVSAIDVDATGALHVILQDKRIFTQWKSSVFQPGWFEMCELGYNPNSGNGWFTPGDGNLRGFDSSNYYPYFSTSFDGKSGLPLFKDSATPIYRWSVWANRNENVRTNFHFGTRIAGPISRDSAFAMGAKPAFISEEDIINSYSDADPSQNPEFIAGTEYPLGLRINESIYSWSFGRYRDLIFIRYNVTNSSGDTLKDCFLAPALDPDLGQKTGDASSDINSVIDNSDSIIVRRSLGADPVYSAFADSPERLDMGYQYKPSPLNGKEYGMIGFALVETPVVAAGKLIPPDDSAALGGYGPGSLYEKNRLGLSSFRRWTISNDPSTAAQRYSFAGSGIKDHPPANFTPNDMRMLLSTGPFDLLPGRSAAATLAIGIAHPSTTSKNDNLDSLLRLMAFAHVFFASPVPGDERLVQHFGGTPSYVSAVTSKESSGLSLDLYPNPSSSKTFAHVVLPEIGEVSLVLSDVTGKKIFSILGRTHLAEGDHTFEINTSALASGSYFVQLETGNSSVEQILIIRR